MLSDFEFYLLTIIGIPLLALIIILIEIYLILKKR